MFDLETIGELLKVEPGHGLIQSVLLFMIWLSSRNIKLELRSLKDALTQFKERSEARFAKIETRVEILETKIVGIPK